MVNPVVPTSNIPVPQQEVPTQGGSSKARRAFVNAVSLGAIGGVIGAVSAPPAVGSPTSLVGLPKDVFEKNLKVPEKASAEAKAAYSYLSDVRGKTEATQALIESEVKKLFPEETLELNVDDVVQKYDSKYKTLADVQSHIATLDKEAADKAKLSEALRLKEGTKLRRAELAEILEQNGIENSQKVAKKMVPARWKFWANRKLKTESVMKELSKGKIAPEAISGELKGLMGLLSSDKIIDGKLSVGAYSDFVEAKNPMPKITQEAESAFGAVKKYLTKNRGQGALKVGGIMAAVGILLGLLVGGRKKQD